MDPDTWWDVWTLVASDRDLRHAQKVINAELKSRRKVVAGLNRKPSK